VGEELAWPVRYIVDQDGRDTGIMFIRGPLNPQNTPVWEKMRETHRSMGLTSMGPYPLHHEAYLAVPPGAIPQDGWKRQYIVECEAWAHCFREPDQFLPPDKPRRLLGGSDFADYDRVWSLGSAGRTQAKRWDIVYSCLDNRFNEMQKNWEFAKACITRLCTELRLKVLIVGRSGTSDLPPVDGLEAREFLPWSDFLQCMARSRVAFFPNVLDASPRVMTEAMSLNLPVLVNRRILGGWKYVNDDTGRFFDDEANVVPLALEVLTGTLQPREWFIANHGKPWAEERLAELVREIEPLGESKPIAANATHCRFVGSLDT
jgi:hypothetical protein